MKHPIHFVHSFEIIGPFTLSVEFCDGISQTIDFSPVLLGQIYGPLQDLALFNKVQIDTETGTLVWPNGLRLSRLAGCALISSVYNKRHRRRYAPYLLAEG